MPNVSQLLDRVIKATNYTDRFNTVDLFNDALNQLIDGSKLEANINISVVADTSEYALPTDFKAPIALIEGDVASPHNIYPLINITEQRFGYSIYNGQIILKPPPAAATTLTLYYYKYATQLVEDEDIPEIDAQWHELLSTYAIGMIHMIPDRNVDKGTVDRYMSRWEEGKLSFIQSMSRKNRRSRVREVNLW